MAIRNSKLLPAATITSIAPGDAAQRRLVSIARAHIITKSNVSFPGTKAEGGLSNYSLRINSGEVEVNVAVVAWMLEFRL